VPVGEKRGDLVHLGRRPAPYQQAADDDPHEPASRARAQRLARESVTIKNTSMAPFTTFII
jgi:hypothetical protein